MDRPGAAEDVAIEKLDRAQRLVVVGAGDAVGTDPVEEVLADRAAVDPVDGAVDLAEEGADVLEVGLAALGAVPSQSELVRGGADQRGSLAIGAGFRLGCGGLVVCDARTGDIDCGRSLP